MSVRTSGVTPCTRFRPRRSRLRAPALLRRRQVRGNSSASVLELVSPQPAKPPPLRSVGPHDPAAVDARQLAATQPPRPPPPMHHDRPHPQLGGQLRQPPLASARQVAGATHTGWHLGQSQFHEQSPNSMAGERAAPRCAIAFPFSASAICSPVRPAPRSSVTRPFSRGKAAVNPFLNLASTPGSADRSSILRPHHHTHCSPAGSCFCPTVSGIVARRLPRIHRRPGR